MLVFWIILMLTGLSISYPAVINVPEQNFEKIVMDVDAGADDAFAITLVIKNEHFSNGPPLIAITCVHGNTKIKNVKLNVLRTLKQLDRADIPVYVGANESIFGISATDSFFGNDGFGDFYEPTGGLPRTQKEHAVTALIRLVSANPGQITLMALGPLTNLALALKLDPNFIRKLKKLVILGGSAKGIGNIKPGREFNTYRDPEAFHIVMMKSKHNKVTLFPWDTVFNTNISMEWRRGVLGKLENNDIKFLNMAESNDKMVLWKHGDGMAAASYIWPSTILSMQPLRVSVVSCGEARGGLLVDYYHADQNISSSNVNLIHNFDSEEYKRQLLKHFEFTQTGKPKRRNNRGRNMEFYPY